MILRIAVMFSGKLSSGPLRPVCRMRQVLGVSDASLDLIADLVDGSVAASVVGVER